MCFDCLSIFPPFSSSAGAGAKKALSKLSRPNSPEPEENYTYGPPLDHDLNIEDLPPISDEVENEEKKGISPTIDDGDSGTGELETISEHSSTMDPNTGMELDAVVLMDMDKEPSPPPEEETHDGAETEHVYEQDVEEETSLDVNLPAAETSQPSPEASGSDVTNETASTVRFEQTLPADDGAKQEKTKVVGHLEVNLDYDEDGGRLKVAVMKATDLPSKKQGGFSNYRIRVFLKPNKQQSSKTKIRPADAAIFRELFRFRQVPKDGLATLELYFKLHGCGKLGKEKYVADASLNLTALKAVSKQTFNLPLSYTETVEK